MAKRGLAAASIETRRRVARAGGRASHGGGRPRRSGQSTYFSQVRRSSRGGQSRGKRGRR